MKQEIQELEQEIKELQDKFDSLDERWKGVKVVSVFGGTYNHARYFRNLERQSLYSKLKRRKNKLRKLKTQ